MGTPKFLEIVEDPYTNNSNDFILVLMRGNNGVADCLVMDLVGTNFIANVQLVLTDATAYPYVVSTSAKITALVPPGFKMSGFGVCLCLIGSLEDLRGYL